MLPPKNTDLAALNTPHTRHPKANSGDISSKNFDLPFWNQKFDEVWVDPNVASSPVARRFQQLVPDKIRLKTYHPSKGVLSPEQFDKSKRKIHLTEFRGSFFKKCPGHTKGMACCNYFVLNLGFQCDMNCSYCYLQSFLNSDALTVYTNGNQALEELDQYYTANPESRVRVGTGELIDSLSLDPITLYSRDLIQYFKKRPLWKLEFKTKSAFVDQFVNEPHGGNVIVSWSLNPQNIITSEEHGTASLNERLKAAKKCSEKGFPVAFHIDPMIWHPQWQKNYGQLVREITSRFAPEDVAHISMGAIRCQPEQKNFMRERFGMESLVTQAELFRGRDGKLRYDSNLRKEMFQFLRAQFLSVGPQWKIFLCMETPETWLGATGAQPYHQENIKEMFQHQPKIRSLKRLTP